VSIRDTEPRKPCAAFLSITRVTAPPEGRRVSLAGITRHPDQAWMRRMARNATGEDWGFLDQRQCVLHDRDTKLCPEFRATLAAGVLNRFNSRRAAQI
jgi:hypothetical protein